MRLIFTIAALVIGSLVGRGEAAIVPLQVTQTNTIFSANADIGTWCSGNPANCNLNNFVEVTSGGSTPLQLRISSATVNQIFDLNVNGPTQLNVSGQIPLSYGFAAVDKNFNGNPNGSYSLSFRLPTGFTSGSLVIAGLVGTAVVPLPAAALLFGTGLLGLGVLRRRPA